MRKSLQDTLVAIRELILTTGPFALLTVVLLVVAYKVLNPTPPSRVVLATGAPQGAYAAFGQRYAEYLARFGITVELRPTQGAAENLALLRDPSADVDLAFVQGGADTREPGVSGPENEPELVSLGSLFYEPVWLFYREDSARRLTGKPVLDSLTRLDGWRIDIGASGSGVPVLMGKLLEVNRIEPSALTLKRQTQTPAVVDLIEGRSDAVVFASAPESGMVQMLLGAKGIHLLDFAQAEAYSRRFPFMSPVVLPRGVVDLAGDVPPRDVHLLAPTAMLISRAKTHPALMQLFVQAAEQAHGGSGWFQRKGDFPNTRNSEWPIAAEAQRIYQSGGTPFLQRWMPFWAANLVDRMWPVLLSIIAVLIPLSRMLPPVYEWRIRSRIFRWYAQLRDIDSATGDRPPEQLLAELVQLDERVGQIRVPLSHADELYTLRSHIAEVRRRIENGENGETAESEAGKPLPAAPA